jgi:hypothetical protein
MKSTKTPQTLFAKSILASLFFVFSFGLMAQEKGTADLKGFKITIEKTDDGIKMQSWDGSAWIDLSFSLSNNKPQAIDEFGMTSLGKESTHKDSNLADYLFTITKTKDGIVLTGLEGTAWKELSFPLSKNCKSTIDQFGMTE